MENKGSMRPAPGHKVHVNAVYTLTAREKRFVAEQDRTVQQVIDEAYNKLEETRRPNDQFFCGGAPRTDLSPYLTATLRSLIERGVCIHDDEHEKLVFDLNIDAEPGGAI